MLYYNDLEALKKFYMINLLHWGIRFTFWVQRKLYWIQKLKFIIIINVIVVFVEREAEVMAQWWGVTVLAEDLGSIPIMQMAAPNYP